MDPITAALISGGLQFLTSPRGPSQAQIDAAQAKQAAAERQKWIIGGALAGGALLLYLVASRR